MKKKKYKYAEQKKRIEEWIRAYWKKQDDAMFKAMKRAADHLNPCGKPHNNGEDTCQECLTIKEGI